MAKTGITVGLDVGGAHLKVARVIDGKLTAARMIGCPLWRGIDHLDHAFAEADDIIKGADRIAVTMTGELADLFENRRQGVAELTSYLTARFGPETSFWCGPDGFKSADFATANPPAVSSMNYYATAAFAAQQVETGIFADMGSTTTDLIPFHSGKPRNEGLTDAARLATGELVYTGFTRTAVMAIAEAVPLDGRWQPVVDEYFATMADVRRVLGELPDGVDLHAPPDGKGKSVVESENRLARMFGFDGPEADLGADDDPVLSRAQLHIAARHLREAQLDRISRGLWAIVSRQKTQRFEIVVTAGIGASALTAVSARHNMRAIAFADFVPTTTCDAATISANAPAVAVAFLANASE